MLASKTQRLLARAKELIGTPYHWGGTTVEQGFDCSGLLVYLFRTEAGVQLPRTTSAMLAEQQTQVKRKQLRPGDAVFFNSNGRGRIGHVGLYLGEGRFIHAPRSGKGIRVDSLDQRYWKRSFIAARRYMN
ncbi:MAG: Murein DD-endopeptidase MepH [Stenotrophomonas maltophilia]|nr:MAG: Murein DD-endopeptidase MepH [Stenotrophomonas maltophilia]